MQEAADAIKRAALTGTKRPSGDFEKVIDSTKEAKLGPWRPYLEMYISRFSDTMYDELLEKVDHVADKRALVFSNNFITTVGGTDNAVAVWRFLMAPMKHTEIQINGIKVLFTPPQQPVAANVSHLQDRGMLRLEMVSQQRWHLPTLLVLVRWVFGDVLSIHVTTTLTVDPDTGRLLHQQDVVNNWLTAPLVLRLLLGLSVPLATVLIKP